MVFVPWITNVLEWDVPRWFVVCLLGRMSVEELLEDCLLGTCGPFAYNTSYIAYVFGELVNLAVPLRIGLSGTPVVVVVEEIES